MFYHEPDFNRELEACHHAFNTVGQGFLVTNENVGGYVKYMGQDLTDAHVLSVCSSGDHAFTFYGAGAKQVDTFDVNYTQKLIYELKNTMIRKLSYYEFVAFFYGKNNLTSIKLVVVLISLL